jgi:hypothetical protein
MRYALAVLVLAVGLIVSVDAATNAVSDGAVIVATWASQSPKTGDPVIYGTIASGAFTGVALNGSGVAGENVSVALSGIYQFVIDPVASMSIGAPVYITNAGGASGTGTLTDSSAGALPFGRTLDFIPAAGGKARVVLGR